MKTIYILFFLLCAIVLSGCASSLADCPTIDGAQINNFTGPGNNGIAFAICDYSITLTSANADANCPTVAGWSVVYQRDFSGGTISCGYRQ